jgi:ADP-ribose pyrophosphatase
LRDEEREFEVLSRRPTHRARKYVCAEEQVRLHDGSEVVREVIRHPGAAVILPLLPDGRIMLVRVWRHAARAWLLEVPAGTLESGEDPAACAARELEEETGYVAECIEPLGSWLPSPSILAETMHLYRATGLRATETNLDDDEHLEPVPMTTDEIVRSMGDGGITDGKTLLALFLGGIVAVAPRPLESTA